MPSQHQPPQLETATGPVTLINYGDDEEQSVATLAEARTQGETTFSDIVIGGVLQSCNETGTKILQKVKIVNPRSLA